MPSAGSSAGLLGEQLDDLDHRNDGGNLVATLSPVVDLLVNDGAGRFVAEATGTNAAPS